MRAIDLALSSSFCPANSTRIFISIIHFFQKFTVHECQQIGETTCSLIFPHLAVRASLIDCSRFVFSEHSMNLLLLRSWQSNGSRPRCCSLLLLARVRPEESSSDEKIFRFLLYSVMIFGLFLHLINRSVQFLLLAPPAVLFILSLSVSLHTVFSRRLQLFLLFDLPRQVLFFLHLTTHLFVHTNLAYSMFAENCWSMNLLSSFDSRPRSCLPLSLRCGRVDHRDRWGGWMKARMARNNSRELGDHLLPSATRVRKKYIKNNGENLFEKLLSSWTRRKYHYIF